MYEITNQLKNSFRITWRILFICKQEIMWFYIKVCKVHAVKGACEISLSLGD
jgi:hypothetical protein